jgi:hypothetical protein
MRLHHTGSSKADTFDVLAGLESDGGAVLYLLLPSSAALCAMALCLFVCFYAPRERPSGDFAAG